MLWDILRLIVAFHDIKRWKFMRSGWTWVHVWEHFGRIWVGDATLEMCDSTSRPFHSCSPEIRLKPDDGWSERKTKVLYTDHETMGALGSITWVIVSVNTLRITKQARIKSIVWMSSCGKLWCCNLYHCKIHNSWHPLPRKRYIHVHSTVSFSLSIL